MREHLKMNWIDSIAPLDLSFHHTFWARAGGYRIVAELPEPSQYWTSSDETRQTVDDKLRSTGTVFLISVDIPSAGLTKHGRIRPEGRNVLSGCCRTGYTEYFVLPLSKPQ
jgi:hypothetical protein